MSGGIVGKSFRNSPNATLNASTLTRSRVAWAILYFWVARRLLRRSSLVNVAIPVTVLFSRLENHCFFFFFFLWRGFQFFSRRKFVLFLIRSRNALTFFSRVYCVRPRSLEASNPPLNTYHKIKNPSKYKNNNEISFKFEILKCFIFV